MRDIEFVIRKNYYIVTMLWRWEWKNAGVDMILVDFFAIQSAWLSCSCVLYHYNVNIDVNPWMNIKCLWIDIVSHGDRCNTCRWLYLKESSAVNQFQCCRVEYIIMFIPYIELVWLQCFSNISLLFRLHQSYIWL